MRRTALRDCEQHAGHGLPTTRKPQVHVRVIEQLAQIGGTRLVMRIHQQTEHVTQQGFVGGELLLVDFVDPCFGILYLGCTVQVDVEHKGAI